MARDIYDTLAQGFTGVIVQFEAVGDAIACCRRKEANEHLQRASELARQSLNEARRSVHALRPQALEGGNFWDALKDSLRTQLQELRFTRLLVFVAKCAICR